jgi:hypothetical protein
MNDDIIALQAQVAIEAGEPKPAPTFEAVIYAGGVLQLAGWDRPVVIDLTGLQVGKVLVANMDHDPTKRVGNFAVENDGNTLIARGVASAATEARREVVESAKAGYLWQCSVEVQPVQVVMLDRDQQATINGRQFSGPLAVIKRGTLKGFAFVSHGADDFTSARIAARTRKATMTIDPGFTAFVNQILPDGIDDFTPAQVAMTHANYCGRMKPTNEDWQAVAPLIEASGDPVENESKRLRQIEAATRGEDWGEREQDVCELKAQAISGALSVDELIKQLRPVREKLMYEKYSDMPTRVVQGVRGNEHAQIVEASLCLQGGLSNPEKHYNEQVLDAAYSMRHSVSLSQLILAEAVRRGYSAKPGERLLQGNLRQVLAHAFAPDLRAGANFSTISLPTTLANMAAV